MPIFTLDPKTQIILVNADISDPEGTHTVRMILDTGASYTMLHPDVLVKIGCEPTTLKKQKITTASGKEGSHDSYHALHQRDGGAFRVQPNGWKPCNNT